MPTMWLSDAQSKPVLPLPVELVGKAWAFGLGNSNECARDNCDVDHEHPGMRVIDEALLICLRLRDRGGFLLRWCVGI